MEQWRTRVRTRHPIPPFIILDRFDSESFVFCSESPGSAVEYRPYHQSSSEFFIFSIGWGNSEATLPPVRMRASHTRQRTVNHNQKDLKIVLSIILIRGHSVGHDEVQPSQTRKRREQFKRDKGRKVGGKWRQRQFEARLTGTSNSVGQGGGAGFYLSGARSTHMRDTLMDIILSMALHRSLTYSFVSDSVTRHSGS